NLFQSASLSGQQIRNYVGGQNAGQLLVESLIRICHAFVVVSQQLQNRGVQAADIDRFLDDVVREIVGVPVASPRVCSAAGHPHGEAAGMVVPSVILFRESAL